MTPHEGTPARTILSSRPPLAGTDNHPMRLFEYDPFVSMTRVLCPDERLTIIDVGAHVGVVSQHLHRLFPNADIHAFEPSPETFAELERNTGGISGITCHRLACGSRTGTIPFHVTGNSWCSSVLRPSDLGKRFYGDWYDTRKTIDVQAVRLDDWTRDRGIDHIDFLKCDAQGYDLEVLKGAEVLLTTRSGGGLKGLHCEFQFAPEYEGCATFTDIDAYLRSLNFTLYQMHELCHKGNEEQTSYGDGLWLRTDVLEALRRRPDLPDLSPRARITRVLSACASRGRTRVALYGAGRHTRDVLPKLAGAPLEIVAVIDDNPALAGTQIEGKPVVTIENALASGFDAVILSSDAHEKALWESSRPLREAGVEVLPLYEASLIHQVSQAA